MRYLANILRWNFHRELDTAVWFGSRCQTLPKIFFKMEFTEKLPKASVFHKLYAILLPDASH